MSKRRKIMGYVFLVLSIVISAYFIPWKILITKLEPTSSTVQEQIDTYTQKLRFEGIIVHIEQSGDVSVYSSGFDNRDDETPADSEKLFRIASISKLYMAVAATMLIDEGILSLEDTLEEMLPELSEGIPYANEITLRMMIQHRSGLFNFVDSDEFPWEERTIQNEDVLEILRTEDAVFKPNQKYKYSNSNYALLGLIMDKELGYGHDLFIKSKILDPLQLNDTYYYTSQINLDDLMSAYTEGFEQDIKDWEHIVPGGNMISTAKDVAVFNRALRDGTLLSSSEQAIYEEVYTYEHTGLVPGYQSMVRYDETTNSVIVVFVNTTGRYQWSYFETLYNRIVKIINE